MINKVILKMHCWRKIRKYCLQLVKIIATTETSSELSKLSNKKKNNLLDVTAYEYDDFFLNQFISPLNNKEKYIEYATKNLYAKNQPHNTII